MLAEDIGKKLAMAEQVGAEGKVEESMKLMEEVSPALEIPISCPNEFLLQNIIVHKIAIIWTMLCSWFMYTKTIVIS